MKRPYSTSDDSFVPISAYDKLKAELQEVKLKLEAELAECNVKTKELEDTRMVLELINQLSRMN